MWSFGCILVELFTGLFLEFLFLILINWNKSGHPIFPGENEEEQLSMIMEVIDLPPINVLGQGTRTKLFFGFKFFLFFIKKKFF